MTAPPEFPVRTHPRDKLGTVPESGIPERWHWLAVMSFLTSVTIGITGVVIASGTGDDFWFVLLAPFVALTVVAVFALFFIGWREVVRDFRR